VDYVYALVSAEQVTAKTKSAATAKEANAADQEAAQEPELDESADELEAAPGEEPVAEEIFAKEPDEHEPVAEETAPEEPIAEAAEPQEPDAGLEDPHEIVPHDEEELDSDHEDSSPPAAKAAPGFSKLLDSLAGLTGFYGSHPVKVEPVIEPVEPAIKHEPAASQPHEAAVDEATADDPAVEEVTAHEPLAEELPEVTSEESTARVILEGSLQNKLTQVRAKADEARMARLRANAALYEGLAAAYDFALDAEEAPEEYLRLVEAQGLKIQLRSPMKPVVKLAFAGMCDDPMIKQLEAVLAWAFDEELPRGTLAERIEAAGGIGEILNHESKAA
jgi:hypothetical protein